MSEISNAAIQDGMLKLEYQQLHDEAMKLITALDTLSIRELFLGSNNFSAFGILQFSKAKWDNLVFIELGNNKVGNIGCKYLSRTVLKNLDNIILVENQIGSAGISHLSKAQWNKVNTVILSSNPLSVGAVKLLTKADWRQMDCLLLNLNDLTPPDMFHLLIMPTTCNELYMANELVEPRDKQQLKTLINQKIPYCDIYLTI